MKLKYLKEKDIFEIKLSFSFLNLLEFMASLFYMGAKISIQIDEYTFHIKMDGMKYTKITMSSVGKKTIINVKIDYLFFDIKLTNIEKNTIESYIEEFDPDKRKDALNIIEKKKNILTSIFMRIPKKSNKNLKIFASATTHIQIIKLVTIEKLHVKMIWNWLDGTEFIKNVLLDNIEKVITQQVPDFVLFWNIESSSMCRPGYLPIGEEEEDYVNKISCDPKDFHIIILDFQEKLLLKFAELFEEYSLAFEIGFNIGGYDWGFILKKVMKLNIEDAFNKKLFNFTKINAIDTFNKKINNFSKTIENFQKNVFNLAKNSLKNNFKFTKENIVDNVRESIVKVYEKDKEDKIMKQYCRININNCNIKINPTENITCEYYQIPGTHAAKNNMLVSSRRKGYIIDEKYKGGYVMQPLKEDSKRPVADLDFHHFIRIQLSLIIFHLIHV
ncbi:hypothetical protein C2G38_2187872 [Gigaspora rosea]|uniref:DNA-directed DNA polymerase family B exonuclease domain-containing protein n=1 Tax=Gigaspora rosea TaxID=44941 RepID=A0A397V5P4_9GLOM|nr:hypothetical protein C2G38_2187872 [Gigaspora rosea]